eukprot:GHVP01028046.1.p1 GENE.GHVP01028046.1~~GHVP01028046.1.p1  ORF type:complete len:172 (+),score=26.17 GHVP01028046.1:420-935(+)
MQPDFEYSYELESFDKLKFRSKRHPQENIKRKIIELKDHHSCRFDSFLKTEIPPNDILFSTNKFVAYKVKSVYESDDYDTIYRNLAATAIQTKWRQVMAIRRNYQIYSKIQKLRLLHRWRKIKNDAALEIQTFFRAFVAREKAKFEALVYDIIQRRKQLRGLSKVPTLDDF